MAVPGDTGSLLVLTPLSGSNAFTLPPFSAVGVTQVLEPIDLSGGIYRTVNGDMLDLTEPAFRKYRTSISCTYNRAPVLDKAWQGMIVQMDCACELCWVTGDTPERTMVPDTERTSGHFTFARPRLIVMITKISHAFNEWPADYAWSLEGEEV